MISLAGLRDDYGHDGRVLFEVFDKDAGFGDTYGLKLQLSPQLLGVTGLAVQAQEAFLQPTAPPGILALQFAPWGGVPWVPSRGVP
jgi:hypothetical protein